MPYNNKFSPKAIPGKQNIVLNKKKTNTTSNSNNNNDEWGMNFNRQGSKKGIGNIINLNNPTSQFMSNKLAFTNGN
jgi:hypothetical protein